jgi:hypothetical protein
MSRETIGATRAERHPAPQGGTGYGLLVRIVSRAAIRLDRSRIFGTASRLVALSFASAR